MCVGDIRPSPHPRDRPRRVLVACNQRHILRLVQVNLQRVGYEVTAVPQDERLLERARGWKPDLVVLDHFTQEWEEWPRVPARGLLDRLLGALFGIRMRPPRAEAPDPDAVRGEVALARLRADPGLAAVPVIVIMGRAADAEVFVPLNEANGGGRAAYMVAPFNPMELLALVKRLIGGAEERHRFVLY